MIQLITQDIRVSIDTTFEGTFYRDNKTSYAFAYIVTIDNQGKDPIQLLSRHWDIKDSLNFTKTVDGDGVIGEQPIIKRGESHRYNSGCLLQSSLGSMQGYYNMVNMTSSKKFRVGIPNFRLSAPFAIN